MKAPNKNKYSREYSLVEMFCCLSAWTGQSVEAIGNWSIPQFIHMWKTYMKEKQEELKFRGM